MSRGAGQQSTTNKQCKRKRRAAENTQGKVLVNPKERPVPSRAPKRGDRIEYQWDLKALVYKKGKVTRGGSKNMHVDWDEKGLQTPVPVKGKEGWWFFDTSTPKTTGKCKLTSGCEPVK